MALGDGIRRNIAHVSTAERQRFRDAIVELNSRKYPDNVSKWVKQDQIHQATHVHKSLAFLPWHRELCNRFELLLREVDADLSLHYWDWTEDPRQADDGAGGAVDLFTPNFMGTAVGAVGVPFNGFPPFRREVKPFSPTIDSDSEIINSTNGVAKDDQWKAFWEKIEGVHETIHSYIGGSIGDQNTAFEDPFVFLLHSNVDRLWAMWQKVSGQKWRLDSAQVYGKEGSDSSITANLEPWAGRRSLRPWAPPDNEQVVKNSKDPTVVAPPSYDTLPSPVGTV